MIGTLTDQSKIQLSTMSGKDKKKKKKKKSQTTQIVEPVEEEQDVCLIPHQEEPVEIIEEKDEQKEKKSSNETKPKFFRREGEAKRQNSGNPVTLENVPKILQRKFRNVFERVEKDGDGKKWLFEYFFEVLLECPPKLKLDGSQWRDDKQSPYVGRVFFVKVNDSTYKYKDFVAYGFSLDLDNCKTKDELKQRQDKICEKERKNCEKQKNFDKNSEIIEPDICNWVCYDQGAVGKFRNDKKDRDGSSRPVSFPKVQVK